MRALAERIEAEIRARPVEALQEHAPGDEFIVPHFERYSLVGAAGTVLAAFGLSPPHPPLPAELLPEKREVKRVVMILIDALGHRQLRRFLKREPDSLFQRLIERGRFAPLTSVFPSTTAAALTTLHTGLPPQEHGVVGYRLFLKEPGLIANLLRLKPVADPEGDRLLKMGLRPGAFLGVPTVHERLKRGGVHSFVLIDRRYAKSGLSQMLSPKAASIVPVRSASDMAVQIRKLLESPVERAFIFAYWDALDAIAHERGPETEEWDAELKTLAFALEQGLFQDLEAPWLRETLVLLLADHGQLRVLPKERVVHLKRHPSLVKRLRLSPTGEYRATYLYAKPGALRNLEEGLRGRFAEELVVLRSEEALAAGLFGPPGGRVHPETRDRLGDLIVVPRGPQALYWPYDAFDLVGRHGGLTDEEMLVPLIAL